jgi:hypothetical protein
MLVVRARLASHSVEEATRYSANACYAQGDESALPLKLVHGLLKKNSMQQCCSAVAMR